MNRARTAIVAWSRSMSAVPTTKLFINGKFVESKTKDWIDVHNPATNEVWQLLTGNLWRKLYWGLRKKYHGMTTATLLKMLHFCCSSVHSV